MGRSRVVLPEIVRLELSDGDWIDVKKTLNAGEHRKLIASLIKEQAYGRAPVLDTEQVGLSKAVTYLVDWSLVDPKGKKLPIEKSTDCEASLKSLDVGSFAEILKAIEDHETVQDEALEAAKNGTGGETNTGATSSSVS